MPNVFGANGIEVATRAELVAYFTEQYQTIYGADITLTSDTPDGQMMNIFIQAILDLQDLLVQIYNGFDPDLAIGVVLDQRVAINGIQRQAGTYTITPITIVNTASVNLYGLDQTDEPVYTVQDNAGNKWLLQSTQLGVAAGTHVYNFRAEFPGAQLTIPNTIDTPVTIVLGVASVNNPSSYTTLGVNEESDAALRIRRQRSVALGSQGYWRGLIAALENITGVTSAAVYENTTDAVDADGIPGHSIWVIVGGTAAAADIAQAIYTKRNAGCGMKGDNTYLIETQEPPFTVRWDDVAPANLFIKFSVTSINGTTPVNIAAIRSGLVTSYVPGIDSELNVNQLATYVQAIDPNCLVTNAGFSDGMTQILELSGLTASGSFKINYAGAQSAAINWNDSISTVESKIQATTGMAGVAVTGGFGDFQFILDFTNADGVDALVFVSDNTLQTSAPLDITFSYNEGYELTFLAGKQIQPIVTAENIIIIPMIMNPPDQTVSASGNIQMSALGGYGDYHYDFIANNSGGTINATSGLYTAGVTPAVDTLIVSDDLGNFATTTVIVN